MNKKFDDIKDFANTITALMNRDGKVFKYLNFIVGIAPTMIGMLPVAGLMKKWITPVAQFVSDKEKGAYTGQISYKQVHEYNINYALVGHSETRQYLNVTDKNCHDVIAALVSEGMRPVLCIGESIEQYKDKQSQKVLTLELMNSLKGLSSEQVREVIIAYEPIWAIGAQTASLEYIAEMAKFIRQTVESLFDKEAAEDVHILYGGTVNADNAYDIMSVEDIDGVLVGGASLDAESFFNIISSAPEFDYVKRLLKPKLALDPIKAKKVREKQNKKYKIKK
ncbi:MAG: triose-phosphate isomerase [Malacoplasma sp.]|nr:triose-phosphate isomerase [Malacoplasma sp.]